MLGDAGARESVRPVLPRRRHAYLRPTIHERDAKALCPEAPKRRCRLVVEAGVVGCRTKFSIVNSTGIKNTSRMCFGFTIFRPRQYHAE